jgi:GAF domain-containing protein
LTKLPVGARLTLEGDNVAAMVLRTGRTARMNSHEHAAGSAAAWIRDLGLRSGVGAPIIVEGRLWGSAIVGSSEMQPLPPDTEARLADFAELVATAIANAEARGELMASRARIVTAADEARRRIERDLHDGAQQRLVAAGLKARSLGRLRFPPTTRSGARLPTWATRSPRPTRSCAGFRTASIRPLCHEEACARR